MPVINFSHLVTAKPANGVIYVELPSKMLNASKIFIRELKIQTTATPFVVKLRTEGQNSSDLKFSDLGQDGTFISSGPQLNQIWHQQFEFPGLAVQDHYSSNAQAGALHIKVMDENNNDFAWTQLFIRFQLHYDETRNATDNLNWSKQYAPTTYGNGSIGWN